MHKAAPIIPFKAFFIIIGGPDKFLMRTILMQRTLKKMAIPLKMDVFAKNMTRN